MAITSQQAAAATTREKANFLKPRLRPGGHPTSSDDIRRIADHQDREAFVRLFADYAPRVKAYLIRHGVTAELAEDLAQETLVRVWRRAGTFDPDHATVGAWIFTIARNLHVDALRREQHPSRLERIGMDDATEPETPAQVLETSERERQVHAALLDLPADQLQVLQMAFFAGHTHAQIARELGMPLGTVKSRLRLALARVRETLRDL